MNLDQINKLLKSSEQVIADCCLKNGAIVAANSTKSYFPKEAKDYKFVWPRDAMYACLAAKMLGLDVQEKFFKWCMKAEGWNKTGLFYEKYFPNGRKARNHFQPDQTGSALIALHDYYKDNTDKDKNDISKALKFEKLVQKCANGLCRIWEKDHFKLVTQDLWEERLCFPDLKDNFTYSLAICSKGLFCANQLIPNEKWLNVSNEMRTVLLSHFADNDKAYFYRSFGKINDNQINNKQINNNMIHGNPINDYRIDSSLLGLVWPSRIVKANDKRMVKTIKIMEDKIVRHGGVHRYELDEYDGWMYKKEVNRKKGAGYWPLLNFWMGIYYLEVGNKKKALVYYNKVLQDLKEKTDGRYIPEQIFNNNIQVSVSPLCWSHAMFVIASRKLGYF